MDPAVQQILNEIYQVLTKPELTPEDRRYITGLLKGVMVPYKEAAVLQKRSFWDRFRAN